MCVTNFTQEVIEYPWLSQDTTDLSLVQLVPHFTLKIIWSINQSYEQ